MTYKPDLVIYHDNCDDGYAAAMVCNMRWPSVKFFATNYGRDNVKDYHVADKHVLIVDFSFPAEQLSRMADLAASVLVLDHHKSAKEALSSLPQVTRPTPDGWSAHMNDCREAGHSALLIEFDMERSGARMAWDFCYHDLNAPMFIKLIEDRDLWRFSYPLTAPFCTYLRSVARNFTDWQRVKEELELYPARVEEKATAAHDFKTELVNRIADCAVIRRFDKWDDVAVIECCPYELVSDVCSELLKRHPGAPFSVAAVRAHGGLTYSFRSTDDREDVSEIAKSFGGGGHRNAAGARIPL
ncbi:DHHA1 domain-containing protein [uncultured Cohaesibacter sp.]|uniref:DHHA1 domain-containing protein n=1 Tax=uncultured Cohaesibacter sp. TaxID=1002546 RepID=UPI0029C77401|nr:DHHA1 domain-containing protein [uncultured Cohaesibacter sp.]